MLSRNCSSPIRPGSKKTGLQLYGAFYQMSGATGGSASPDDSLDDPFPERNVSEDDPLLESFTDNSSLVVPMFDEDETYDDKEDVDQKSILSTLMGRISARLAPASLANAMAASSATDALESPDDRSIEPLAERNPSENDPLLGSLIQNSDFAVRILDEDGGYDGDEDIDDDDKNSVPKSIHSIRMGGTSARSATTSLADAMADPDQVGTASIASEVMSITKNILGAGVLSLSEGIATYSNNPNAMVSAIAWVILLGGMFGYFCLLIAKICKKTRSATYRECWESTMGDRGGLVVSIVSALLPAQGNLSATTVLSQTLQSLLATFHIYWSRVACLLFLTVFVLLPMCLMKDLNSISTYSTIGVASIGVAAIAMVVRYLDESYQPGGVYYDETKLDFRPSFGHETSWNAKVLPFVCMVFNSYIMHYNSPRFYMELKDRSIPRYTLSVALSFGLASIILILIAGAGFLTFGENSSSYILNNYSPIDPLATASRIGVFLSTLLMYPIAFFGVRDGILDVFGVPHYQQTSRFLDTISVLVLSLLTIVAIFVDDLGVINSVGGGALATFLCVIFPVLMYRQLIANTVESNTAEIAESWVALLLMMIGVVLGTLGVYQSVIVASG